MDCQDMLLAACNYLRLPEVASTAGQSFRRDVINVCNYPEIVITGKASGGPLATPYSSTRPLPSFSF